MSGGFAEQLRGERFCLDVFRADTKQRNPQLSAGRHVVVMGGIVHKAQARFAESFGCRAYGQCLMEKTDAGVGKLEAGDGAIGAEMIGI